MCNILISVVLDNLPFLVVFHLKYKEDKNIDTNHNINFYHLVAIKWF